MHEALIAGRTFLCTFCMKVYSRCEPNKRGVSPEVGVAPKIRTANFLLLSSKSGYAAWREAHSISQSLSSAQLCCVKHLSMQSPTTPLPGQGGAALSVKPSPGGGNFVKSVYQSLYTKVLQVNHNYSRR